MLSIFDCVFLAYLCVLAVLSSSTFSDPVSAIIFVVPGIPCQLKSGYVCLK